MSADISIIVLTLNEGMKVLDCIWDIHRLRPQAEIIIADGGSTEGTIEIAQKENVRIIPSPPGRGIQCRSGAQAAQGNIFIFLHVDTKLPQDAFSRIEKYFARADVKVARFRLRFDHDHWLLKFYSFFTRFDSVLTRFGDQGIIVRRDFYEELGGFPDWPLFEDVEFFRRARRRTKVYVIPSTVVTSARRFLAGGILRQQIKNGILILKYLLGVQPEKLAREYARRKER